MSTCSHAYSFSTEPFCGAVAIVTTMNCDSTIGYSENFAGLLSHLIIFWPCLRAGGGGGGFVLCCQRRYANLGLVFAELHHESPQLYSTFSRFCTDVISTRIHSATMNKWGFCLCKNVIFTVTHFTRSPFVTLLSRRAQSWKGCGSPKHI